MIPGTAIFDNFLGKSAADALFNFAKEQEQNFAPSSVDSSKGNAVSSTARKSSTFSGEWLEHKRRFARAVIDRMPEILSATGIADWSPRPMQIDLAAHRDGDFFRPHIDTQAGQNVRSEAHKKVRIVSAVYYVHGPNRAFSGGELVLRDIRSTKEFAVDPLHDRLVVFPSFLPHEVTPVRLPGDTFSDARFSVNCWLNRNFD